MIEGTRTLEERVAMLEDGFDKMSEQLDQIIHGQGAAADQIINLANEQSEALKNEAQHVRAELLKQSQSILGVSASMIKLQTAIQRWAAAGTLAGSVVFYIIAKAAGF